MSCERPQLSRLEDTRLDLGEMRDSGNPQLLSLRIRVSPHLSWLRFGYVILSSVG